MEALVLHVSNPLVVMDPSLVNLLSIFVFSKGEIIKPHSKGPIADFLDGDAYVVQPPGCIAHPMYGWHHRFPKVLSIVQIHSRELYTTWVRFTLTLNIRSTAYTVAIGPCMIHCW